ncbi:DUF1419 domain-containing protein [Bosea sp. (in: a-proteobacteria)]|uniref:DUF1419 domain-containing protein n=1 Tax=Bosea sp. (in: a-proteobacteria) TaxID=1871050 RepID=UPI000AFBC434|nr:DUF1419 domain-containing protein [Bosea sp. (in: a-proteobacteria)]MDP3411092.1 DUF1419 domain-containing protein [Bosea sp. (in: a-proteobacteria)]
MTVFPICKVFQGVADRRQMFRLFDRHAQRPDRRPDDGRSLYAGEWFEIGQAEHDYMFEVLPPLILRVDMFALREFLTGSITSVFFTLWIDGRARYFHSYCDLADIDSGRRMREAIIERETRPVRAMTRQERLEHIWSSTHDDYRGYAGERWPVLDRGKRTVTVYGSRQGTSLRLLDGLTDAEVSEKLPVHLRYLPDAVAA